MNKLNNKTIDERDKFLSPYFTTKEYNGGWKHFSNVPLDVLKLCVKKKWLNPKSTQNNSPATSEFIKFLKSHSEFTAHGYVISAERDDCRITIEGLEGEAKDEKSALEFMKFNANADELTADNNHYISWWD